METKEKLGKIFHLAIPATIENVLQTLVGFVDTLMISRLGLLAVTAVGISNNIFSVYLALIIALGVATSSLVSRALGAGLGLKAKTYAVQATALSLLLGLLLGLITLLFAGPLLGLMGADREVQSQAMPYFLLVGAGTLFIAFLTIFGSILRARGDSKTPMLVNTAVNLLNLALDYVLIFGLGSIPALGILGTAIGTVLARMIGSIFMFAKLQETDLAFGLRDLLSRSNYQELIQLSIPAVLERLVMRLGQVLYMGLIVSIGVKVYAAHMIAGNIESFTYMPGYGLAAAASILVGNSIGAQNPKEAYAYGKLSMQVATGIMALGGLVLFIGSPWFATWFTQDREAIANIVTALRIDAFIQVPLAISLVAAGALQGAGDTKSPLYATSIGMWGLRVVGVYLLGLKLGWGIAGVWLSILIDLTVRAAFLLLRFRKATEVTDTIK